MDQNYDNPHRQPLVTVEFQNEIDAASGRRQKRMFVKMYFEAWHSGLLAAIPDREWKTLCALATFMDENGNCYPSQDYLAKGLGITRQNANERIRALRDFRFHGQPVISITKRRLSGPGGSRWASNVYRIHAISSLKIFGDDRPQSYAVSAAGDMQSSVSGTPDTGFPDMNEIQKNNQIITAEPEIPINATSGRASRQAGTRRKRLTGEEFVQADHIARHIIDSIGQPENYRAYFKLAADAVTGEYVDRIFRALGDTKEHLRDGTIRTTPSQYFHAAVRRLSADDQPNSESDQAGQPDERNGHDLRELTAAKAALMAKSRFPSTSEDHLLTTAPPIKSEAGPQAKTQISE